VADPTDSAETDSADDHDADPGLTIEALANVSGVPVRTIRYYQSRGLLQRPQRRGRQAMYGDEQVSRLADIDAMSSRGISLDAISEIIEHAEGQLTLSEWFGLTSVSALPIGGDFIVSRDTATEQVGGRVEWLDEMERVGTIVPVDGHDRDSGSDREPDHYRVMAPNLYNLAAAMARAGADLSLLRVLENRIRELLGDAATASAEALMTVDGGTGNVGHQLMADVSGLHRAIAEGVGAMFLGELTNAIEKLLATRDSEGNSEG